MKGRGRRIVVDADVGRAAANISRADRGEVVNARALAISRSLRAFLEARNVAVFSPSLHKEWQKHAGRGGCRWFARMLEKKLIDKVIPEPDSTWLEEIIKDNLPESDAKVAHKDRHLVTLAIAKADLRILSCDGKAREKYVWLVPNASKLERLHWVDPGEDSVPRWLTERAPDHRPWMLGFS